MTAQAVRNTIAGQLAKATGESFEARQRMADGFIAALLALPAPDRLALCAALLPDGWVAVPREATGEMLTAAMAPYMYGCDEMMARAFRETIAGYHRTMIAASPTTDTPSACVNYQT